jgi:osmotically-inducible protein OsmY
MRKLLGLVALGAALTYFFHPQEGRRRRAQVQERITGFFQSPAREAEQVGHQAAAQAEDLTEKAKDQAEKVEAQLDDVTLARNVETEIFRGDEVTKDKVDVNAENGKIYLRGEVEKPELIQDLEERTRKVQGVQDVENLLRVPGAEAPATS